MHEFVPEVWIDNDIDERARPFVLLHELHERNVMSGGWDYDRAHENARNREYFYRHNSEKLHFGLAKEVWE